MGVDWKLDLSLNFYRHMYQADWMAKVERDPPPEAGGFDYYVPVSYTHLDVYKRQVILNAA